MTALNLYRRNRIRATLLLALLATIVIAAAQRRSPHKLRATALVELSTDHKGVKTARLIPIVVLEDGQFHDASIYKTAPAPMALESGVVYEAQKNGEPIGFVTISGASKDRIWTGLGKWQAQSDRPKPKPSATPGQSASDERPRLHRSGESTGSATPLPAPSSDSGDDRPTLRRPPSESSPQPSPSTSPAAPSSDSGRSDDRPTLRRPPSESSPQPSPSASPAGPAASATPAAAATPTVTPEEQSASVDPNRPTLRRGKPTPTPAQEENSPQPAASVSPTTSATKAAKPSVPATPPGTQLLIGVSDAEPGDSRSYQFMWKPGEEAPIDAKLRRQAAARLAQEEGGRANAATIERELKNVVIRSFDLDLTNDAIMVLTAELPPSTTPAVAAGSKLRAGTKKSSSPEAAAPPVPMKLTRYITLIARVDLDGNPEVLAANLTDSSRLDIAPRLEVVDAVDVDGDGIAELLFREYDFDNQTFVIYAVRRGAVSKLFEGASQALN